MLRGPVWAGRVVVGWERVVPGNDRKEDMVPGGAGWVQRWASRAAVFYRPGGSQAVSLPSHSSCAISSHEETVTEIADKRMERARD